MKLKHNEKNELKIPEIRKRKEKRKAPQHDYKFLNYLPLNNASTASPENIENTQINENSRMRAIKPKPITLGLSKRQKFKEHLVKRN